MEEVGGGRLVREAFLASFEALWSRAEVWSEWDQLDCLRLPLDCGVRRGAELEAFSGQPVKLRQKLNLDSQLFLSRQPPVLAL